MMASTTTSSASGSGWPRHPRRISAFAVPLHVRRRQCQRPERVRAAWRSDVHQSRHAAGGEERRRSGRRARARDQPRALCGTAPRRRARPRRIKWARFSDRLRARFSAASPARPFRWGARSASAPAFLKYGREYERQADLLGAQIMARAGYDPRDMANMFQTIQAKGGGGGPEWMSSHPNPGNRYEAITKEVGAAPRDRIRFATRGVHAGPVASRSAWRRRRRPSR